MGSYAVIQTSGRQERVVKDLVLDVNRLSGNPGDSVTFEALMAFDGKSHTFGKDAAKTKVTAEILKHTRGKKINVIKFKRRKKYRRSQGHRQDLTVLKITEIK